MKSTKLSKVKSTKLSKIRSIKMSEFTNMGMKVQEYVYDFAVDGGVIGAIDLSAKAGARTLPDNALVKNVWVFVETAVVGTSSTMSWGNTTDVDGYSGAAVAEATLVADYIHNGSGQATALLWDDTGDHFTGFLANSANDRDFSITIATGALTAGKVKFFVEYFQA